MADDEALWDGNGPGGLTVVIPLLDDIIHGLMISKHEIEMKKNIFFKRAQSSGYISMMASEFLLLAIDEFVPSYRVHNRQVLIKFLRLSNIVRLDDIGIPENHVLVSVAGIRIILLNLEEAVFRADLFSPEQHLALREISARKVAATRRASTSATFAGTAYCDGSNKCTKTTAPPNTTIASKAPKRASDTSTKATSDTTATKGKRSPSKKSTSATKSSKKHCMNGAECRNILNGTCRFHHTAQEIARAGAIIEECIGISLPKVGWIIGTNGDNITTMRKVCGADIWIEDEIVLSSNKQKIRMLHVLGSREAVVKGIELVMESAAGCHDEDTGLNNVEALIGVSPVKQKELLGSSTLELLKEVSGADILAGENDYSLRVVGTKKVVEKAIELVMQWAAHSNFKTREKPAMSGSDHNVSAAPTGNTSIEVNPSPVPVSADSSVDRNDGQDDWPALGLPRQTATPSPRISTKPFLQPASEFSVDARNASEPPADINDNTLWPALEAPEPSATSTPKRVPDRPAIQPAKKTLKKSTTKAGEKKIKKNSDVCMHGAACRFIRNGVDDCEFYHSPKELELAAAVATKKSENASKKVSSKKTEYVMRISRSQAAWVIGRKGNHVKEIIQKSGVEFSNDPAPDGSNDDRIVRIIGTKEAVDIAVAMVMKRLPDRDKAKLRAAEQKLAIPDSFSESGDEPVPATSPPTYTDTFDTVSALELHQTLSGNIGSKPTTFIPPPSPASQLCSPPLDSQPTNPISPPQPIRQFQQMRHETSFASSAVSALSVSETLFSDDSRNISQSSLAGFSLGREEGPITGQAIPMLAPSISSSRAMTPLSLQDKSCNNSFSDSPLTPQKQMLGQVTVTATAASAFLPSSSLQQMNDRPAISALTSTDALLTFLNEQEKCLKGSPELFLYWLSSEDIASLEDLAEAVCDDEYLRDVLQQGDGNNGVKGFKRAAFKKAVIEASQAAGPSPGQAGPNVNVPIDESPPSELVCPISQVLMTDDPVIAADGHTYERSAIEAWFQKQTAEVAAAQQQMATVGSDSQRAREIIHRGVLSPMTHSRMEHLALTPNHAVRTMAKDSASSSI